MDIIVGNKSNRYGFNTVRAFPFRQNSSDTIIAISGINIESSVIQSYLKYFNNSKVSEVRDKESALL